MSLTTDHGNIIFQCDSEGCHQTLETGTSDFNSARNMLRRNGWDPYRPSPASDWKHTCKDCTAPLLARRGRVLR